MIQLGNKALKMLHIIIGWWVKGECQVVIPMKPLILLIPFNDFMWHVVTNVMENGDI